MQRFFKPAKNTDQENLSCVCAAVGGMTVSLELKF